MSWSVVLQAFGLVFLAELGDKTQLATMLLSAQSRAPLAVFAGATAALALTTGLGVALGQLVVRVVPRTYLQTGAGLAFIALGILLLLGRGQQ